MLTDLLEVTREQAILPESGEWNAIAELDLGYIIDMMSSETYPLPRWKKAMAERCCQLYKNFLFLQRLYPNVPLVPTREIDEFWHNHILHTKAYTRDCQQIFGHYLHHTPASPDEDISSLVDGFKLTKQLYFATFNHELTILLD